jgi:hypothetical protein
LTLHAERGARSKNGEFVSRYLRAAVTIRPIEPELPHRFAPFEWVAAPGLPRWRDKVLASEAPAVLHPQNIDQSEGRTADDNERPAAAGQQVIGGRRQMAASFQLNVDNAAQILCPKCSEPSNDVGLALNLTIGPVLEGMQVLLVRPGATMREVVDDVRRALINDALRRAEGNQARAAKLLGMKYTTFHTLSRRLGIGRVAKPNNRQQPRSAAQT